MKSTDKAIKKYEVCLKSIILGYFSFMMALSSFALSFINIHTIVSRSLVKPENFHYF